MIDYFEFKLMLEKETYFAIDFLIFPLSMFLSLHVAIVVFACNFLVTYLVDGKVQKKFVQQKSNSVRGILFFCQMIIPLANRMLCFNRVNSKILYILFFRLANQL